MCVCVCIYTMYVLYEYTGKQRPTFSSVRKVTLNGCYGINTNDNNNGVYPPHVYTTIAYIYTAIASRQPRSSVPAAIYIVFIALRAVSIHFYHCFTVYTFPIYIYNIYKPYIIYCYYFFSYIQSVARPEANIDYRPDEYIRYIIAISPPSTYKYARILSGFRITAATSAEHPQVTAARFN